MPADPTLDPTADPTAEATRRPVRRALVSVYDKTGLAELATALHEAGVEIVSTGSTAARIAGSISDRASANTAGSAGRSDRVGAAVELSCASRGRHPTDAPPPPVCVNRVPDPGQSVRGLPGWVDTHADVGDGGWRQSWVAVPSPESG